MADINHHESGMLFEPNAEIKQNALVKSMEQYSAMHRECIEDPEKFWGEISKDFYWKSGPTGKFLEYNFDYQKGPISIQWMKGAVTNMCYNMLDRNIGKGLGDKVAFYWEGNDPHDDGKITYSELLKKVCKCANVLKSKGVRKGDRVAIYMPMIVELTIAMLACARIGAVHSIVFGGFSAKSLADRIIDGECKVLIIGDGVYRGTKLINYKELADNAMERCSEAGVEVENCIIVRHLSPPHDMNFEENGVNGEDDRPGKRPCHRLSIRVSSGRDHWWHDLMTADVSDVCEPEWLDAEDPLFMLYTSGSTGKPKGVLHTIGGYMMFSSITFKYSFDYHDDDIYWCAADIGWITGHTYICYGPLGNGATGIIFEGTPFFPDPGRFWAVVDKYKVTKFHTAPTVIRSLMKFGDHHVTKYSRESLRVLGTIGEPINPEAWLWYRNVVGNGKASIVDTFLQTETGGHVITPFPGATPTKPGSATLPFFGILPEILNEDGTKVEGEGEGYLVFGQPWPGIMRTVYKNPERFETAYFKKFQGYYCTGDGAKIDKDGYIWITGRIDDMLNVSGHLLSTAEIESALVEHTSVSEAAVVSHPHAIKGECTYCFVTLKVGEVFTPELVKELKSKVREKIGPFAQPDFIQDAPGLPKTRSGKILRRVLRKIARGDNNLGDVSTMVDSSVVEVLFEKRPNDA